MSDAALATGARIGPYEVLDLVGRGGMGEVYRARDTRLSREVALKVLHAEVSSDPARLRRFEQEARAAGMLNHPNIVGVYDTGDAAGLPYIVSELLQGEALRERLISGGLAVHKALDFAVQIARGLAAAHDKGIVHRDLKPENVFVTKDGVVKILDFGIAKLVRPDAQPAGSEVDTASHTSPGTLLGTMGYMSPEQVRGLEADHRSDLFAFGAVLFEMLTGRRAFAGSSAADTLSAILREHPAESLAGEGAPPEGLVRVVRRCLEKAPEDRFQSARDLAFAIEFLGGGGSQTSPLDRLPASSPRWRVLARVAVAATIAAAVLLVGRQTVSLPGPAVFQRLTFQLGDVTSARFTPNGETIVYSSQWGGAPIEVFTTRAAAGGARSFSLKDALVAAVSSREEIAVLLRPRIVNFYVYEGTLAKVPLAGGVPRELLEGVIAADWSVDGKELAVIHGVGDRYQIEFPIGHVLYAPEAPAWLSSLKFSPRGDTIAFTQHPQAGDSAGELRIVSLQGRVTTLAAGFSALMHVAGWISDSEVWFGAARTGGSPQQVHAATLSGRTRVVSEVAGALNMHDLRPNGDLLCSRATVWTEMRARSRGGEGEIELPGAEATFLSDLSNDGKQVLSTDMSAGGGPNYTMMLQATDGSPPVRLGEGDAQALSPDGRWVLAILAHKSPPKLVVVPTGAGEVRELETGPIVNYQRAVWAPNGTKVVFSGAQADQGLRLYVQEFGGGPVQPVSEEGVTLSPLGRSFSPDGVWIAAIGSAGVPALYPLAGGPPRVVPGLGYYDRPVSWTSDGRELYVVRHDESPPRIDRVEVATGRARPWTAIGHTLPSGVHGDYRIMISPDGQSYVYNYVRKLSDLYLATGLR